MGTASGSRTVRFLARGEDGQDAVRHYISFEPAAAALLRKKDGTAWPSTLKATGMKQTGSQPPAPATGCTIHHLLKRLGRPVEAETQGEAVEETLSVPADVESLTFRLRSATGSLLCEATLSAAADGEDGQKGDPGEDGKPGEDGAPGQDAVSYDIEFSFLIGGHDRVVQGVPCDAYGNPKTGTALLKAQLYRTVGSVREKVTAADGLHIVFYGKDSSGAVLSTSQTGTGGLVRINVTAAYFSMEAVATDPSTGAELCRREIFKTYDGTQGLQGCIYRRTQWEEGKEYRNDSALAAPEAGELYRYIDIVGILDGETARWFECRQTHTSSLSNKPVADQATVYWKPLNSLAPTYTPLLLADNAVLTLVGARQIVLEDIDGSGKTRTVLGLTGRAEDDEGQDTNVCFWIGPAPTSVENTMVVTKDGTIMIRSTVAVKAVELGVVNVNELDYHDLPGGTQGTGLLLQQYFDAKQFNFHGTGNNDVKSGIVIPPLDEENTSNVMRLYDGVEFSFFNQPVVVDEYGTLKDGDVYIQASGPVYWNRRFQKYGYPNTDGWDTYGKVQTIRLPAFGMLRMRSVRLPRYNSDGTAANSYSLCWVILNCDDFYAAEISVNNSYTGTGTHNPTAIVRTVNHRLLRITKESEAEDEGITITETNIS